MTVDNELVIEPKASYRHYWRDLWDYRELFAFLAWRDISVRYRQTVLGIAWSVLQPVLTMIVFTVVFGRIANLPSGGAPYPLLVLAALIPWQFFTNSLTACSASLVGNANMITKIYFPRLALPTSSIIVSFVDLLIAGGVLLVLMAGYQVWPTLRFLALIPLCAMATAAALGAGLWFASLNVKYRDFRYLLPFVVQLGTYVSPVGFSSSLVPNDLRLLYSLNPMVGVIDGFRWAILGQDTVFYLPGFLVSIAIVVVVLVFGLRYFRATERSFADVI
jgi:lipopolysaccharide transport system permease protein